MIDCNFYNEGKCILKKDIASRARGIDGGFAKVYSWKPYFVYGDCDGEDCIFQKIFEAGTKITQGGTSCPRT